MSKNSRRSSSSQSEKNLLLAPFPILVHKFLTETAKACPECVRWTNGGKCFNIDQSHPDLSKLIGKYFNHSKFKSLQRRLNSFGWRKQSKGYYRENFHRDPRKCNFSKIKERPRSSGDRARHNAKHASKAASTKKPDSNDEEEDSSTEHDYDLSTYASLETSDDPLEDEEDESNQDDKSSEDDNVDEESVDPPPEPKYHVFQTVYARDKDGVMYEAVIRRRLYGQNQHKQVQLGLVESQQEANRMLEQEEEPTWHYFVHYNKWNVNWDRWVPECNVYEPTDQTKMYASRLMQEHRALRSQLTRKVKGKKGFQTINGAEFLRLWRLRMLKVDEEMKIEKTGSEKKTEEGGSGKQKSAAKTSSERTDSWTKAAVSLERNLREKNLAGKRQHANTVALPFALKKNLVEQWEIISQCQMVPFLPVPFTVRQALDKYLETKGIDTYNKKYSSVENPLPTAENLQTVVKTTEASNPSGPGGSVADSTAPLNSPKSAPVAMDIDSPGGNKEQADAPVDASNANEADKKVLSENAAEVKENKAEQEWLEMAEGVALLFDEALPNRLLYREEFPQLHVLESHPEFSMKRYSDIYGCEHLLRLFVRLPELIADVLSEVEARPVFAKVNDFVRFLNKNVATMLAQHYRKLNELEIRERNKLMKQVEKKRKRAVEMASEHSDSSKKPREMEAN